MRSKIAEARELLGQTDDDNEQKLRTTKQSMGTLVQKLRSRYQLPKGAEDGKYRPPPPEAGKADKGSKTGRNMDPEPADGI